MIQNSDVEFMKTVNAMIHEAPVERCHWCVIEIMSLAIMPMDICILKTSHQISLPFCLMMNFP